MGLTQRTNSNAIKVEQEKNKKESNLQLKKEQRDRYNLLIDKVKRAKNQRDQIYQEFDDMTYEDDYYNNKVTAMAYLRPKINDDEVRVVTGTTEKKLETLSNELQALNLQPEIIAHDQNDSEIKNLGRDFEDIVKRTNEIEKDEDFWQRYINELISQRAAFAWELDEFVTINDRKKSKITQDGIEIPKDTKGKPFTMHRARKKLVSGLRIYLGDMNVSASLFQTDQPYIVAYSRYSYAEARSIYQNWSRWNFVTPGRGGNTDFEKPYAYRMNDIQDDEVEELRIFDPINDEYDVILNGIPMMEDSTPLPYDVLPDRRYPISMVTIKTIDTDFAYGKAPVNSAKFLQGLNDEMIRNLVRKFRQALEPAMGIRGSGAHVYSKDIWEPGAITQGVSSEDFSILNPDNKGVTQSEFSMYDLIERKTAEFIGSGSLQQGVAEPGEQTATEIQALQKNSVRNLGHMVSAFMRAKRDTTFLRIYNIMENFTEPTKNTFNPLSGEFEAVFSRFTIRDATLNDGTKGTKVIQFTNKELEEGEKEALFAFEEKEKRLGRPIRVRAINVKKLLSIPIFWKVVITQQARDGSALQKILYKDQLEQAVALQQITGRKINPDKAIDNFQDIWQAKDFFQRQAPQQEGAGNPEAEQQLKDVQDFSRSNIGSQLTEGVRGQTQRPSLNNIATE